MKFFVVDGASFSQSGAAQEQTAASAEASGDDKSDDESSSSTDSDSSSSSTRGGGASNTGSGNSVSGSSSSSESGGPDSGGEEDEGNQPGLEEDTYPIFISVTSSSDLPGDEYTSYYGPNNLMDHDIVTGWSEGADGNGVGERVELDAGASYPIHGLYIVNGFCKREDLYCKNRRPKDILVTLSNGKEYPFTLKAEYGTYQRLDFGP